MTFLLPFLNDFINFNFDSVLGLHTLSVQLHTDKIENYNLEFIKLHALFSHSSTPLFSFHFSSCWPVKVNTDNVQVFE